MELLKSNPPWKIPRFIQRHKHAPATGQQLPAIRLHQFMPSGMALKPILCLAI
jgi:hypothetical protein